MRRVLEYIEAGIQTVPVPYRSKAPRIKGWKTLEFRYSDWERDYSAGPMNIGFKLNGLTDVDLDCQEAVKLAPLFLPDTRAVFGRPSKPESHWLYRTERTNIDVLADPVTQKNILEVRANGQSIGPGSYHEDTGEAIEWAQPSIGKPVPSIPTAPGDDIFRPAKLLATASLLGRYWPEGSRHDLELALAGGFLRSNRLTASEIEHIIDGAWRVAGHQPDGSTAEIIKSTQRKIDDDSPVTGWPTAVGILGTSGQKIVDEICAWFGIEAGHYLHWSKFWGYSPLHMYFYEPTGELWVAAGVDSRVAPVPKLNPDGSEKTDRQGNVLYAGATSKIDRLQAVEGITWWPGQKTIVRDVLVRGTELIPSQGARVFNTYRSPNPRTGDPELAKPWIDHVMRLYPDDGELIIKAMAQRVQSPGVKINWALVLGGGQGIGKDTILEPVTHAIGSWNCYEVSPSQLLEVFNPYVKSVILRVSEIRDMGEVNRWAMYDFMKVIITAPPEALVVNEKHKNQYSVPNVTWVVFTTNHRTGGMHIDADDRRHFVVWSDVERAELTAENPDYFKDLYDFYGNGGHGHVKAYLESLDISDFNPKAEPPKTAAWREMVAADQTTATNELADLLDELGEKVPNGDPIWPTAITFPKLLDAIDNRRVADIMAFQGLYTLLTDAKHARHRPDLVFKAGYTKVHNPSRSDGRWRVNKRPLDVYVRKALAGENERFAAVEAFIKKTEGTKPYGT